MILQNHQLLTDSNNWYVLISSSKFYFNYRHTLNILMFYNFLKSKNVPDQRVLQNLLLILFKQIILMIPDSYGCNSRNPRNGEMLFDLKGKNYFPDQIEVDYKGFQVSSQNILNLLRGRYKQNTPKNKILQTDSNSKILIYMNGHGGQNFFKIQDTDIIQTQDLSSAFYEMHAKQRYKQIILLLDTCQAESLFQQVQSPNIVMIGSSRKGQNALSYQQNSQLNVYLSDRFTYFMIEYLKTNDGVLLKDLLMYTNHSKIRSHVTVKSTIKKAIKSWKDITIQEYFGKFSWGSNRFREVNMSIGQKLSKLL